MGIGSVNCAWNGRVWLSPIRGPSYAFRIDSVVARITQSGPAAATSPLFGAMLMRDEVEGGRFAAGHGDGSSCNLASPAIAKKPNAYIVSIFINQNDECIRWFWRTSV